MFLSFAKNHKLIHSPYQTKQQFLSYNVVFNQYKTNGNKTEKKTKKKREENTHTHQTEGTRVGVESLTGPVQHSQPPHDQAPHDQAPHDQAPPNLEPHDQTPHDQDTHKYNNIPNE